MDAAIQNRVNTWLNGNYDQESKYTILRLQKEAPDELADAFYRNLEFGTGGLRGIMGVGTNRVNKYTIGAATQGFANYLKKIYSGIEIKVAIAYDLPKPRPVYLQQMGSGFFYLNHCVPLLN